MGSSQARSSSGDLARRADAYHMEGVLCEGYDVYEVRATLDRLLRAAREESKPAIVEVRTYRYRGHSVADPDTTYRTKQEVEEYRRTKDPLQVFQARLLAEGVLTEALVTQIDQEARAESDLAADFADASPFPTVDDIQKDVYWEADHPAERQSRGRLFFD